MPKGKTPASLKDLVGDVVMHRVHVERYATGTTKKVDRLITDATDELRKQLERQDVSQANARIIGEVLGRIKDTRVPTFREVNTTLTKDLVDLSKYEADWARGIYKNLDITHATTPGAVLLRQLATQDPLDGLYVKEWTAKLSSDELTRIRQQLRIGISESLSEDEIVRRIIGGRGRKGVVDITRHRAEGLVRTSVGGITAKAHHAFLEENADEFPRYLWVSVLDAVTTPICRALAGEIFQTGEGPLPPQHPNCRSTIIGIPKGTPTDELPKNFSYDEWLKDMGDEVAREILGPNRFAIWKAGTPVKSFVDESGKAYTLDELREADEKVGASVSSVLGSQSPVGRKPVVKRKSPSEIAKDRKLEANEAEPPDEPSELIVPHKTASAELVAQTNANFEFLPEKYQKMLADWQIKIVPTKDMYAVLPDLAKDQPQAPGSDFNAAWGLYSPNNNMIIIKEGSTDTFYHEVGHAFLDRQIDKGSKQYQTLGEYFREDWALDVARLTRDHPELIKSGLLAYYTNPENEYGVRETFAELFTEIASPLRSDRFSPGEELSKFFPYSFENAKSMLGIPRVQQ